MDLSPEATKAALTALMYAYLRKAGADAKIPDFSSSFGYRLTGEDQKVLEPLFEAARRRASDEAPGTSITVRLLRANPMNDAALAHLRFAQSGNPGDLIPVQIFGRDQLPS